MRDVKKQLIAYWEIYLYKNIKKKAVSRTNFPGWSGDSFFRI